MKFEGILRRRGGCWEPAHGYYLLILVSAGEVPNCPLWSLRSGEEVTQLGKEKYSIMKCKALKSLRGKHKKLEGTSSSETKNWDFWTPQPLCPDEVNTLLW